DLAKVMVCVLVISVAVTLVVIPPLMMLLGQKEPATPRGIYRLASNFQALLDRTLAAYLWLIEVLLRRRMLRLGFLASLSLAFIASLLLLLRYVDREIMAEPDTDKVWLSI